MYVPCVKAQDIVITEQQMPRICVIRGIFKIYEAITYQCTYGLFSIFLEMCMLIPGLFCDEFPYFYLLYPVG